MSAPATIQHKSSNDKLSRVSRKPHPNGRYQTFPQAPYVASTYTSIKATCPDTCVFKGNGCYPQVGNSARIVQMLDEAAVGWEGEAVNRLEAELLDNSWRKGVPQDGARGGRDGRLHVAGDTATPAAARALGQAVDGLLVRGAGSWWTYTHRWREISPADFGPISALASCETPLQLEEAIDLGWFPAITVVDYRGKKAYDVPELPGVKIVPCPAQTHGTKCIECRLCFKPLPKGRVIGFKLHGVGASKAARRLPVLGQLTLGL